MITKPFTYLKKEEHTDHYKTGSACRKARKAAKVGLNQIARELGVSGAYVSDLEHGHRAWSLDLVTRYNAALQSLAKK